MEIKITHYANPVPVTANVIKDVSEIITGGAMLVLDDGRDYYAKANMTARHWPEIGDYLVRQEDGYEYLNPKAVFEHKYRAADPVASTGRPAYQQRVVDEHTELNEKVNKLAAFLVTPTFARLEDGEQSRLINQVAAMRSYADILAARILAFPV